MKTRCATCGRATDETEEPKPVSIRNVMKTLGITADVLFARIREDLERGLVREARAHLDFVDQIGKATNDSQHRKEKL
jgi:hypothetical protein